MKKSTFRGVLREFSSFLLFFLMVGFVVSCCMMLFLQVLSTKMGLLYTPENIAEAAKITFLNVLIITALFKTVDYVRRKIMVEKPVKIITEAAGKMMNPATMATKVSMPQTLTAVLVMFTFLSK